MKKVLLTFLLLLCNLVVWSDNVISNYSMSYFTDQAYDIYASVSNKDEDFMFLVCAKSKKGEEETCGFAIESKDLENLLKALRNAEEKYQEWSATAKENKVTNFEKFFDVQLPRFHTFFTFGSSLYATKKIRLKPKFKVTDEGQCLLCLDSGTLRANNIIEHKGFVLAFNSVDEIEEFMKALDATKVLEMKHQFKENNALFK